LNKSPSGKPGAIQFHGGKFNGRFFDPERSSELLEHSITILMASILISRDMLEAYENRTD